MSDWKQKAEELYKEEYGYREISRMLNVPYSTTWDHLTKVFHKEVNCCRTTVSEKVSAGDIIHIETSPTAQGPTIVYLPDAQVKPDVSLEYLRCQGEYIAHKKPDVIVCAGDFADMESLSSYDKGKKSAEGKRVTKDIEAAIQGMNTLLRPIKREQENDPSWKPRMVLTLGNHECLKPDVEVLTKRGFIKITEVTCEDLVAQRGADGETVWDSPVSFIDKVYDGDIYRWSSRSLELSCTPRHRVLRKTSGGKAVYTAASEVPDCLTVFSATTNNSVGVEMSDNEIRLGAWLCTDSHFTHGEQAVIYQRLSNSHKIEGLLCELNISYKKVVRDRDIKEVCGKVLKERCEPSVEFFLQTSSLKNIAVTSNTELPSWAGDLNDSQWEVFLDTLIEADGTIPTNAVNSRVFYGKYRICSHLQEVAVTKGWSASLTEYRENLWRVNLVKRLDRRQENAEKKVEHYKGTVHCLEMPLGNFIIRDKYKVHVTGNCRINRHVDANAELDGFLSIDNLCYKEFGWEVVDFLEPIVIGGVTFIHYWPNPMSGKPLGGSAANILQKVGCSVVQGHRQTLDVATRTLHNGVQQWSIVAGASYDFDEHYKGFTGNKHWRGIVVMHNVKNGGFDPLFVSTEYLKERF